MTTGDRHPHKLAAERYASAATWHWDGQELLAERYGDLRELEREELERELERERRRRRGR